MFRLYSDNCIREILRSNDALIENICASYQLPPSYLKAVLRMELPELNLSDSLADAVVSVNWFRYSLTRFFILDRHTRNPLRKFDSSTGYGQIFAQVAIEAILFARNIDLPQLLGVSDELFPFRPDDLRQVWLRLHRDKVFNLSCAALNIIHAAFQMTGRIDFGGYSEGEKKMIFSRYNGNVKRISSYGEKAYRYYLEYEGTETARENHSARMTEAEPDGEGSKRK